VPVSNDFQVLLCAQFLTIFQHDVSHESICLLSTQCKIFQKNVCLKNYWSTFESIKYWPPWEQIFVEFKYWYGIQVRLVSNQLVNWVMMMLWYLSPTHHPRKRFFQLLQYFTFSVAGRIKNKFETQVLWKKTFTFCARHWCVQGHEIYQRFSNTDIDVCCAQRKRSFPILSCR